MGDTFGKFDAKPKAEMQKAICGVKNKPFGLQVKNHKPLNYAFLGSSSASRSFTWAVTGKPSIGGLSNTEVTIALKKAFDLWSSVSGLSVTQVASGTADIEVSFEAYDHGDGADFDGAGGTLAHASLPPVGVAAPHDGFVHFDDSETWTLGCVGRGTDFLVVAIHEVGHALGLGHSTDRSSIMYPTYSGCTTNPPSLSAVDIAEIQKLYGRPPNIFQKAGK